MTEKSHETLLPADKQVSDRVRQGAAGDVRPNENDPDPRTEGSLSQEKVEDRPSVSIVKPEDYPKDQRATGKAV